MNVLTDPSLLEYLHDAACNSFVWDCSDRSMRRIILSVRVDDEAGYEPWNGRVISLTLSDVVACRFFGWGGQIGQERIDAWREGISTEFQSECNRLRSSGLHIPPLAFTIILGSGSTIELVCREVSVDAGPPLAESH